MLIEHLGKSPTIDETAFIAPDATVCGEVRIGPHVRIMHGARIIAESRSIDIGEMTIVLENAVLRATGAHDCTIGGRVLIGPGAHVVGSAIEDEVFVATGAAIFHGSRIGHGSEVRINGVVHVNSVLAPQTTVPIGWIACGNPARLFSPDQHDELWAVQEALDFPLTAYGLDRPGGNIMSEVARMMSERLESHMEDRIIGNTNLR